jgi:hypothetical protein
LDGYPSDINERDTGQTCYKKQAACKLPREPQLECIQLGFLLQLACNQLFFIPNPNVDIRWIFIQFLSFGRIKNETAAAY